MTRFLGARQSRFVDEYMLDLNATRAAIAAGYSKHTAAQAGHEVLRNPKVAAEIARRQGLLAERFEVTAENVVSELGKIAFANVADFYTVGQGGRLQVDPAVLANPAKSAALSQIEITESADGKQSVKIRLADKRAALNDLGKHLGLFEERVTLAVAAATDETSLDVRELALAALALFAEAQHAAAPVAALPPPRPPDLDDLEPWYFDQAPG